MTRSTRFLAYFLLPLLLLGAFNYWNGLKATNSVVVSDLQRDLSGFSMAVVNVLQEQEQQTMGLALSSPMQQFASKVTNSETAASRGATVSTTNAKDSDGVHLPDDLKSTIERFLGSHPYFATVTLFDSQRHPLVFAHADTSQTRLPSAVIQTKDFKPSLPKPDDRVWQYQRSALLAGPIFSDTTGSKLLYTVPVTSESGHMSVVLVTEIDVERVFREMATVLQPTSSSANQSKSMVIVLDASGKIIYHSNGILNLQPLRSVMPELTSVADDMVAGKSGASEFQLPSGQNYMIAFSPLPQLSIALAIARDQSELLTAVHLRGLAGLLLALLLGVGSALLLERHFQKKSRGIETVTEGLTAIAKGELDRRIELRSTDDARGIADNINVVTERLRAQLAREAESRHLDSFVKFSAMLTHDLKNAIETLSLIVGNMERHFDNEQFREDAMKSLTGATDKLKTLVARLSKPITTLSGEHKQPLPTDLVPILNRVVALTAKPLQEKHKIEMNLPVSLLAVVDGERIERVVENLVLNALEAMAEQSGTLTISAKQRTVDSVEFTVADTGSGIAKSFIQNRLFHPFATTKKKGVGLGLYTCREVVQANGGLIVVESIEGAGTTFRVVLPSPANDEHN